MLRYLIVTLLVVSSLSFTANQVSQSDDAQPYVYYYSNIENAIVIEHADGTDSRLLGAGLMPPRHMRIIDFDWSASGEWVAWRSDTNREQWTEATPNIWIMRSDGSQRLTILDGISDRFYALKWSPKQDYLMVLFAKNATFSYAIIDAENNKIVARTDFQGQPLIYQEGHYADWLETGNTVIFQIQVERTTLLGSLSLDNRTNTRVFQQLNHEPFLLQKGRIFWEEYFFQRGKLNFKLKI